MSLIHGDFVCVVGRVKLGGYGCTEQKCKQLCVTTAAQFFSSLILVVSDFKATNMNPDVPSSPEKSGPSATDKLQEESEIPSKSFDLVK